MNRVALLLASVLLITQTILGKRRISYPALIVLVVLSGLLTFALILSFSSTYIFNSGGLPPIQLHLDEYMKFSSVMATAVFAFYLGALLFPKSSHKLQLASMSDFSNSLLKVNGNIFRFAGMIGFVTLIAFISNNLQDLFKRNEYLYVEQGSFNGAIRYLVGFVGLYSIFLVVYRLGNQFFNFFNVSTSILIELSSSSRSFGILLFVLLVSIGIKKQTRAKKITYALFAITILSIAISYTLSLRGNYEQGLIPNLRYIFEFEDFNPLQWLATFLIIIPVTVLGFSNSVPTDFLITSLSPLPGWATNWYDISPSLYVNPWTPTGGISQIHNLGITAEILVWILLGFCIQGLGVLASASKYGSLQTILMSALSLNFTLQVVQYSLRSGVRYLYLGLGILIVTTFASRLGLKRSVTNRSLQ